MAIFRCQSCDYLREVPNQHLGKNVKCPSCQASTAVQDTLMAMANMLNDMKNVAVQNQQLQQQATSCQDLITKLTAEKQQLESTIQQLHHSKKTGEQPAQAGYAFANIDTAPELENTQGVVEWLKKRQIRAVVDQKAIDISGFYDEIAVSLGDNFDTLKPLLDRINWSTRKAYDKASFELPKEPEQAAIINKFCRELYEHAFVAKYLQTKNDKVLLVLQKEHHITNFFNGDWLEWYAFMKVASLLLEQKIKFSSLRGFDIELPNNDKRELDLFFLTEDGRPLWIECKSGEFRDSIDKYSKLRKALGVNKEHSILLVSDLAEEKAKGLTSMFDITVLNEKTFLPYITSLLKN